MPVSWWVAVVQLMTSMEIAWLAILDISLKIVIASVLGHWMGLIPIVSSFDRSRNASNAIMVLWILKEHAQVWTRSAGLIIIQPVIVRVAMKDIIWMEEHVNCKECRLPILACSKIQEASASSASKVITYLPVHAYIMKASSWITTTSPSAKSHLTQPIAVFAAMGFIRVRESATRSQLTANLTTPVMEVAWPVSQPTSLRMEVVCLLRWGLTLSVNHILECIVQPALVDST